jgi:phosphoglycerate dehydrogenase-like enzyme
MKVVFNHRVAPEWKKIYKKELPDDIELIFPTEFNAETLLDLAPEADVAVGYKFSQAFLEKAVRLKHIQVPWTGSETLDFDLLKKYPNITVSNSHSNSLAIAEHAVALLMAATKRITYSDIYMRKGDWTPRYETDNGFWVTGKTLGVIGYGAIGKKVAKMVKSGFRMKILAIKRNPENTDFDDIYDYLGGPENLSYVLKESDFILIALPLTEETKGLIGSDELKLMKRTAILVNISRGSIIDEKALYNHLKSKNIFACGSDVWYNYPKDRKNPVDIFQNYPFEELENLVMTPHAAFKVSDREKTFAEDIITNILLISQNKKPFNQLNLDIGY